MPHEGDEVTQTEVIAPNPFGLAAPRRSIVWGSSDPAGGRVVAKLLYRFFGG
jgi:hypothetical protein